jgi:hypothetical protein
MKTLPRFLVGVACLTSSAPCYAVPTAYYNPSTGNVYLQNDLGFSLAIVNFESPSGRLNGVPNVFPGIGPVVDEAPYFLAYFGVGSTSANHPPDLSDLYDLGRVVLDGGPVGDLRLKYLGALGLGFLDGVVLQIPEPTSIILACVAGVSGTFLSRRFESRRWEVGMQAASNVF